MGAADETIHGAYEMVTMSDGTEVLMEKLATGRWVPVESRLDDDSVWDETNTKPGPFVPETTGALVVDPEAVMRNHTRTRDHIEAYLVEILGTPEVIRTRADVRPMPPGILKHVRALITLLNRPDWNRIGAFL